MVKVLLSCADYSALFRNIHYKYLKCCVCALVQFRSRFLDFSCCRKTLLLVLQVFIQHSLKGRCTFLLSSNQREYSLGVKHFKVPSCFSLGCHPSCVKSSFHFHLALGCWPVKKTFLAQYFACVTLFFLGYFSANFSELADQGARRMPVSA